jgi:hypothetical protein
VKTASTQKKWLPRHQQWVHFVHRDVMRRNRPKRAKATLPVHLRAVPSTPLPIDCTGNATVTCAMDGNNTLGICGPAMCDHVDNIRTFGQGKPGFTEKQANLAALESQYEKVSGGDNGTDEDMLVGAQGIWTAAGGGLAGDPTAVVVDHLDVDITDAAITQFCMDWFYHVNMAWSVPDAFLQGFAQGTVWAGAMTPDPQNGHFTAQADCAGPNDVLDGVNLNGFYRLWTWGAWCWVSPAFVASVEPECFVTFSALQFNAQGYDSHGRHVSDVAAAWVSIGGNASLVAPVVSQFPPKSQPTPTPAPTPTPGQSPTLAQVEQAIEAGVNGAAALETRQQAITAACSLLPPLFGAS